MLTCALFISATLGWFLRELSARRQSLHLQQEINLTSQGKTYPVRNSIQYIQYPIYANVLSFPQANRRIIFFPDNKGRKELDWDFSSNGHLDNGQGTHVIL